MYRRGEQSYFGARVVFGPHGLKTDGTPGIIPEGYADVGTKAAGRKLDGRKWNEMPGVQG